MNWSEKRAVRETGYFNKRKGWRHTGRENARALWSLYNCDRRLNTLQPTLEVVISGDFSELSELARNSPITES